MRDNNTEWNRILIFSQDRPCVEHHYTAIWLPQRLASEDVKNTVKTQFTKFWCYACECRRNRKLFMITNDNKKILNRTNCGAAEKLKNGNANVGGLDSSHVTAPYKLSYYYFFSAYNQLKSADTLSTSALPKFAAKTLRCAPRDHKSEYGGFRLKMSSSSTCVQSRQNTGTDHSTLSVRVSSSASLQSTLISWFHAHTSARKEWVRCCRTKFFLTTFQRRTKSPHSRVTSRPSTWYRLFPIVTGNCDACLNVAKHTGSDSCRLINPHVVIIRCSSISIIIKINKIATLISAQGYPVNAIANTHDASGQLQKFKHCHRRQYVHSTKHLLPYRHSTTSCINGNTVLPANQINWSKHLEVSINNPQIQIIFGRQEQ